MKPSEVSPLWRFRLVSSCERQLSLSFHSLRQNLRPSTGRIDARIGNVNPCGAFPADRDRLIDTVESLRSGSSTNTTRPSSSLKERSQRGRLMKQVALQLVELALCRRPPRCSGRVLGKRRVIADDDDVR